MLIQRQKKIPKVDVNNEYVEILDKKIERDELLKCLKNQKRNKALGYDEIGNEFLKEMPQDWIGIILGFFNKFLDEQEIPEDWALILITMIHKKGDVNEPRNYRLIALICCIAKLFTGIMKNRIEQ